MLLKTAAEDDRLKQKGHRCFVAAGRSSFLSVQNLLLAGRSRSAGSLQKVWAAGIGRFVIFSIEMKILIRESCYL